MTVPGLAGSRPPEAVDRPHDDHHDRRAAELVRVGVH